MNFNELLTNITQLVLIPVLVAIAGYIVKWINAKANNVKAKTNNELVKKYVEMLNDSITSAVISVNQTYVDALKGQNAFDKEAQEAAYQKAYDIVMLTLTEEANKYLSEIIGDLDAYVSAKIEEAVKSVKVIENP